MNKFLFVFFVIGTLVFTGCSNNNNVVSKGFAQKRKYNKGWHLNLKKPQLKADGVMASVQEKTTITAANAIMESKSAQEGFQKRRKAKSSALEFSSLDIKSQEKKVAKLTLQTRKARISIISENHEPTEAQEGIAKEDANDDVFVYLSFGAALLTLTIGLYPIIGILFGILALIFALIAIAKLEKTKLTLGALITSIVALGLSLLWNYIMFFFLFTY
jgi:hypothetical protein